jgi:cysteine desulfurase
MLYFIFVVILIILLAYLYVRTKSDSVYSKIYFDNNSTTQPHPEVVKAISDSAYLGNPSASYSFGAKAKLDELKNKILSWCNVTNDTHMCIITSGASEANNLVIRGSVDAWYGKRENLPTIILSNMEHKTSLECAAQLEANGKARVVLVKADNNGTINPQSVAVALKQNPNVCLVSIMHANNETGAINDIAAIGSICQAAQVPFHSDVVQSFGKTPITMRAWNVNAISMSFHKMYGPMGLGCLVVDRAAFKIGKPNGLQAQIAGSQNDHMRGGTENIPAIAGAYVAMDLTLRDRPNKNAKLEEMKKILISELSDSFAIHKFSRYVGKSDDDALALVKATSETPASPTEKVKALVVLGPTDDVGHPDYQQTLPNTLLLSVINLPGGPTGTGDSYQRFCNVKLKSDLAASSAFVSIGSACLTDEKGPSHVLKALDAPFIVRCGVVRISLGDFNTKAQVYSFCKKFVDAAYLQ